MSQLTSRDRRPVSLFGPIVLIAIGLFFLFNQIHPTAHLYWLDVLRLWPLLLIFLGLNVLAVHAPRPYASFFSALVSVTAVLMFGYVLLNGLARTPFSSRLGTGNWQTEQIRFDAADVETAVYDITIGAPGADLHALDDSRDLVAGTIAYQDDYLFDTHVSSGKAVVRLAPKDSSSQWIFMPEFWREYGETNRWQLGLNQNVPATLTLDAIAGYSQLDLRGLLLRSLKLTASADDMDLLLPAGDYDAHLVINATTTEVSLPDEGHQTIDMEVNAGSATFHSPENVALHVEVERALGAFSADNIGLRRVEDQENVWETADYAYAQNRVDLSLHINVGSVTID